MSRMPLALLAAFAIACAAGGASAQTPTPTATPLPSVDPAYCYSVGDTGGSLVRIAKATGAETSIGLTGTASLEALALAPVGTTLYGADAGQVGTIDLATGVFTATASPIGTGNGSAGAIALTDITALTFDPSTGILYGVHNRTSPDDDLLFQISPATGALVANAYGAAIDYVEITGCNDDIEDLAINSDGAAYVIANVADAGDELATVNLATGACTPIAPTGIDDMGGIRFDENGILYGTTASGGGANDDSFWTINTATAVPTLVAALAVDADYESLACALPGCFPQVRKRHVGLTEAGASVSYRITWSNPCQNFALPNVTLEDAMPSGIAASTASAPGTAVTASSTHVTFSNASLAPNAAILGKVNVTIADSASGAVVNTVQLSDAYGRVQTSSASFNVRAAGADGARVTVKAQKYVRAGSVVRATVRFKNLGSGNSLVLTLPSGLTVSEIFPTPASVVDNVITWVGVPQPGGYVRVDATTATTTPTGTILTFSAVGTDASGSESHSGDSVVTAARAASLRVTRTPVPTRTPEPTRTPVPTRTPH